MKNDERRSFTLLEICVTLMILAGIVSVVMHTLSGSAWRIQRSERFRMESQRLANAVEFFMLYPPGKEMEQKFFPYEDMQVQCRYEDAELPESMDHEIGRLRLVKMTVELFDRKGESMTKICMERIVEAAP